ncbi:MAG: CDP-diacylglycerol--glycerol-3-phosphate 3-phosphatidyltransferase [Deltaproteobacteria bacterium]|nr:CDP-diacylglycerol--glycerol-3-phosphate 3-phosphatidyltransferase [Deltaproteobacteria bacterium]MBI2341649.1 CDP-diacylglycerol--glycerol-3-phosphate 3-phosphatidyltransferase [Deltaproteobacteria bacterium]MBI2975230.1 CDP-diacylglycerol--glycerol-3-phosphate 3-phosphatidyltransferase [Deltaproteobacteria bacterium]
MDVARRAEFLNLPNYISLSRIAAVPLLVVLMMLMKDVDESKHVWNASWSFISTVIYTLASISDMLDGFFARRYKIEGEFGKFFDPLADKLLNLAVMIMLIPLGRIPAWFVVLLLVREIGITMLRGIAVNERIIIQASKWGKYKNAFGSFGLAALILHYPFWGIQWVLVGWVLLIVSAVFSIGSGIHYVYRFVKELGRHRE